MEKNSRKMSPETAFDNLLSNVLWMTAQKNETYIAQYIFNNRSFDHIHGLDEAGIFDYLFNFMDEAGLLALLQEVTPEAGSIQRSFLDYFQFILLYIMKSMLGIRGMNGCEELLFTNYFAMKRAKFNATQIEAGITKKGLTKGRRGIEDIRGIINNDTLANNIEKINLHNLIICYNKTIRLLSKMGFFPKNIKFILDTTDLETTPSFPDCGYVVKERPVKRKGKHTLKQKITVYGFKLWAVYVADVEIPVAFYIDKINVHDVNHAKKVIDIALKNLPGHDFASIALDRGFLDGKLLFYIEKKTPIKEFFIPTKSNMKVQEEAVISARGREKHERITSINRGHGKNKSVEQRKVALQVVPNVSVDWFCEQGSKKYQHKNDVSPTLNAVVIAHDDTYHINEHTEDKKRPVFLTNALITNPFHVYDGYDERSLIENELNRQLKQTWSIEYPPKRTEKALKVHATFSLLSFAITSCFRAQQKNDAAKGIQRYRRELKAANRDKVAIFINNHYGIFRTYEPFMLAGIDVKEAREAGITLESILKKYSVTSP